ncbi:MAG TPA: alkaline phosphatase family protein, partial [Tepidisphaeraceae bacterium]|nr:alkaline phosphatase family protein [Tepidisphaeraceae bacterium]
PLVQQPKIWEIAKAADPRFTCANICWWYAMYSSCDYVVTPRPMYPIDGRKLPDIWTEPSDLREQLQTKLGQFPLFKFWGPATSIESTRWIADAAIEVDRRFNPTLSLVYLPHLDYSHQRYGPDDARSVRDVEELDLEIGKLVDHFKARDTQTIVLSEYGLVPVSQPIHINRILRKLNLITVREELGRELIDAGVSQAFAVADHQVAHVYVNDPAVLALVERELKRTPGIAHVYAGDARRAIGLDHPRSGELIAVAEPDAWFTYYYWLDERRRPDYADTVDIHRKPGYDPVELFLDPAIRFPKAKIGWTLLQRRLGFRPAMNVISTDATLVKGSHGVPAPAERGPLLISSESHLLPEERMRPTNVRDVILRHLEST